MCGLVEAGSSHQVRWRSWWRLSLVTPYDASHRTCHHSYLLVSLVASGGHHNSYPFPLWRRFSLLPIYVSLLHVLWKNLQREQCVDFLHVPCSIIYHHLHVEHFEERWYLSALYSLWFLDQFYRCFVCSPSIILLHVGQHERLLFYMICPISLSEKFLHVGLN